MTCTIGRRILPLLVLAAVAVAPSEARTDCRKPKLVTVRGKNPIPVRAARPPKAEQAPQDDPSFAAAGECAVDTAALEKKIAQVLDNPAAQLVLCYQKQLLKDRDTKGTIEIGFNVDTNKNIRDVTVLKRAGLNVEIEQCTIEQVARTTFPFSPPVDVLAIWTFDFRPIN